MRYEFPRYSMKTVAACVDTVSLQVIYTKLEQDQITVSRVRQDSEPVSCGQRCITRPAACRISLLIRCGALKKGRSPGYP